MGDRKYIVTVRDVGNVTDTADAIHTILTSKDHILPRERVSVEATDSHHPAQYVANVTTYAAIHVDAREMALQIINNNRQEVRDFIAGHATPAKLCLAIVRHLISWDVRPGGTGDVNAVVNVQSLIENLEV